MKLAANLNFLFTEGNNSIAERIRMAHKAGFRAVEMNYPNSELSAVAEARVETGIEVALLTINFGDSKIGTASVPNAEEKFATQLQETINFAKKLKCKNIHIMAGLIEADEAAHLRTYVNNLKYAARLLEAENMLGVIEPISAYAVPKYLNNNFERASSVISAVNSKHIRLMIDIFHLQHIMGNVTNAFADFKDIIGHIQIAQAPHRHEPDVAGELDFSYVFGVIKSSGYSDWIGCEYKPKTNTLDGLKWIEKYPIVHL
ncbi:putative hydroxypyruvate isomerase [Ceratitis capitata]|uniref:putative hydroxypyruvate isomerase n=1 Tax=Ceratitis capitata TaxID=7213 RepID=UPI0006188626|nr:putative hydroxypyruvate isomerase [Ceratitis capitata]